MSTHYIEFITNDKHASIGHCVSRLMTMLHGIMRHTEINLGVSFPGLSDNFIGDTVRVFGSEASLTTILSNPQIQDACRRSVCSLSVYVPCPVPASAKKVAYIAVRDTYRNINSAFKRKLLRFNSRHDEPMCKENQKKLKQYLVNKSHDSAYFTVKNNKGVYPIYVGKSERGEVGGEFSSFGLGNMGGMVFDF